MNITKKEMFNGCLIASIAHAIMTNMYPELSYEQSWDGVNYSIHNTSGLRGTITFESDFCVGAIRNEKSDICVYGDSIRKHMMCFPNNVVHKAYEETLQYLLMERNGYIMPCVTSIFWANDITVYFEKKCIDVIKRDFILFEKILLQKEDAIDAWRNYYDMDSNSIKLLNELYQIKAKDFNSRIILSEEQKKLIPGICINDECIESLEELKIFLRE